MVINKYCENVYINKNKRVCLLNHNLNRKHVYEKGKVISINLFKSEAGK